VPASPGPPSCLRYGGTVRGEPGTEKARARDRPAGSGEPGRDLRALPKAELHLHLLGAMRGATLRELAAQAGRQAPDPRAFTTFAEFQEVFQAAYAATQARPENLLRLVREVVADAAADGVVRVQPHFDPHVYPQFRAPQRVMELVLAEGLAAGARHGVGFGVTIAAMRHLGPGQRRPRPGRRHGHGRHRHLARPRGRRLSRDMPR
jgi:adenosine deaminase